MAEAKHCSNDNNWELLIKKIGDDGFLHIMEFLLLKDIDKCRQLSKNFNSKLEPLEERRHLYSVVLGFPVM
jgi:hypothetical protein